MDYGRGRRGRRQDKQVRERKGVWEEKRRGGRGWCGGRRGEEKINNPHLDEAIKRVG